MSNKPSWIRHLEKAHNLHRKYQGFDAAPKPVLKKLYKKVAHLNK